MEACQGMSVPCAQPVIFQAIFQLTSLMALLVSPTSLRAMSTAKHWGQLSDKDAIFYEKHWSACVRRFVCQGPDACRALPGPSFLS